LASTTTWPCSPPREHPLMIYPNWSSPRATMPRWPQQQKVSCSVLIPSWTTSLTGTHSMLRSPRFSGIPSPTNTIPSFSNYANAHWTSTNAQPQSARVLGSKLWTFDLWTLHHFLNSELFFVGEKPWRCTERKRKTTFVYDIGYALYITPKAVIFLLIGLFVIFVLFWCILWMSICG